MKKFKVGDRVVLKEKLGTDEITKRYLFGLLYRTKKEKGLLTHKQISLATNNDLATELLSVVEKWVDSTFNFIQLDVYEALSEFGISEDIEPISTEEEENRIKEIGNRLIDLDYRVVKLEEWQEATEDIKLYDRIQNFIDLIEGDTDSLRSEIEELRNTIDTCNDDNYPIWNTIFELKSNWSTLINNAPSVGFGIINSTDYFNDSLFLSGAGYSFYSQHWIPLYLSIFEYESEKYKNVDYSGM